MTATEKWIAYKPYISGVLYTLTLIVTVIELIVTDLYYRYNLKDKTIPFHLFGAVFRFSVPIILFLLFIIFHTRVLWSDLIASLILLSVTGFQIVFVIQQFGSDFSKWKEVYATIHNQKLLRWNEFTQSIILVICLIATIMGCNDSIID